ncbi:MAG TPA: flagellar basal body-associated protein FliL [Xanthobacteraceae bacterium]|nr:flagellar basal body-associated protein FliL [Xanthobacteraceae bacterium]
MAEKANKEAESDSALESGEEAAAKPKRKLPLKLIGIVAAALLVVGGGVAGFFMLHGAKEGQPVAEPVKPVAFLDLPDLLVNLSNVGSDKTQYLKVKIVLELADQTMVAQVQPVMPRVVDAFQSYLRELRPGDLEGSAGLYRLREELTRRINVAIAPSRINAVLFKEFLVQ